MDDHMMNQFHNGSEIGKKPMKAIAISIIVATVVFFVVFPICYYAMISIPFADDFSYASTMKDYLTQDQNPFLAASASMLLFYNILGGEWFSDYMAFLTSQFECSNLLSLRLGILASHVFFLIAVFFLIRSFFQSYSKKKSLIISIGLYTVILYWITNNYVNTEIYTWHIVAVKYVMSMAVVCMGVGCYVRFFYSCYKRYWILALLFGILANGASLNIAMLNCELYCLLMLYGIFRKRFIWQSIVLSTVPLFSVLVTLVAPGNFARYGNETYYIGGCILGCLYAVLNRFAYLSMHTPYLVMLLLVLLLSLAFFRFQSSCTKRRYHPILLLAVFFLCILAVDSPYVMSLKIQRFEFVQFEDRAYFVQDFSIYLYSLLWVIYLAGYIKEKYPDLSIKSGFKASCMVAGIVLAIMIVAVNGVGNITTVRMWECILNGKAVTYARYQEDILQQIEASNGETVKIVYDTSEADRKDTFILGLRLSEDDSRWDYWYNNAVARFCNKGPVNIIYQ